MEWLRRSQRGSKNQLHRDHWAWPDPQRSSSALQDKRSNSPKSLPLGDRKNNNRTSVRNKSTVSKQVNSVGLSLHPCCCEHCQEDMEWVTGTLLDSSGPGDKDHYLGSPQRSGVQGL